MFDKIAEQLIEKDANTIVEQIKNNEDQYNYFVLDLHNKCKKKKKK